MRTVEVPVALQMQMTLNPGRANSALGRVPHLWQLKLTKSCFLEHGGKIEAVDGARCCCCFTTTSLPQGFGDLRICNIYFILRYLVDGKTWEVSSNKAIVSGNFNKTRTQTKRDK